MTSIEQTAGFSDPGRKRTRNEDSYVLAPPLFAVADGMGGAQAGEVASRLAAAAVEDTDHGDLRGEQGVAALIQEANRRVFERSTEDPSVSGMGTTMTLALVEAGDVSIGHVGDSRAYLVRGGSLSQLTEDHSLVNELVKSGRLSREEAEIHPQRSVITRALGTDPDVDADIFTVHARPGDVFLLCSDGLSSMVSDEAILEVVEVNRDDLDRAARELVKAANRGGGDDNITVVAFGFQDPADPGETARMAATSGTVAPDEEDTLDGIPAVQAPEELGGGDDAPRPEARRRRRRLLLLIAILIALAAVGVALWSALR
ncbi:MAG TPA: Stp1/IreP family PP2C-type Ser/Thr phosphatase [Gaiellaceae bacterium]